MAAARLSISAGAPGGRLCSRFLVAVFAILILPTQGRALNVRLRWTPSPDTRVQGYYVYVREATRPYGSPRDAGAPRPRRDGSIAWVLTGLSDTASYFVAVSAYTDGRVESMLSNELAIGMPNPCALDACTAPTQCTVQPLPDGSACGPVGAACGATCVSGVCAGLADRALTIERLRVRRRSGELKVRAKGRFVTGATFDPMTDGLELTVADRGGAMLLQASLAPADLVANRDGSTIKSVRRRNDAPRVAVRRLLLRARDGETRWKARLVVSPAPATLPSGATVTLESGDLCLSAAAVDCQVRERTLNCR
jgi:hypothetical protein